MDHSACIVNLFISIESRSRPYTTGKNVGGTEREREVLTMNLLIDLGSY